MIKKGKLVGSLKWEIGRVICGGGIGSDSNKSQHEDHQMRIICKRKNGPHYSRLRSDSVEVRIS